MCHLDMFKLKKREKQKARSNFISVQSLRSHTNQWFWGEFSQLGEGKKRNN